MQIFLLSLFDNCTGTTGSLLCALPGITTILEDPQSCPPWRCPRLSQSLRRSLPIHTQHFVLARQYQIVSTTRRKFRPFLDFPCSRNAPLNEKVILDVFYSRSQPRCTSAHRPTLPTNTRPSPAATVPPRYSSLPR